QGFVRVRVDGEILDLEEADKAWPEQVRSVEVAIDRLVVRDGVESRLADAVATGLRICATEALAWGQRPEGESWDELSVQTSYRNARTGFSIGALTPRHFSFNSHLGACPACEGLGTETFCDAELLIGAGDKPFARGGIRGWWKEGSQR